MEEKKRLPVGSRERQQQWVAAMELLSKVYPDAFRTPKEEPPAAAAPKADSPELVEGYSAETLTREDLERILSLYGSEVEDIDQLTGGQKWMMEKATVVRSAFFLQFLLRVRLALKPSDFRGKVDRVTKARDSYRSAYPSSGLSQPYRVVLKHRKAEIQFSDISALSEEAVEVKLRTIMEADRRRGIDLERDSLLRIHVLRLPGEDMHAFIISQPHINTDGVSIGMLIKDVLIDYAMKLDGLEEQLSAYSLKSYSDFMDTVDKQAELDYWRQLLADLPPLTRIPGAVETELEQSVTTYVRMFRPETASLLKKAQGRYKTTLNCIMQGGWGILLQKLYGREDVSFGSITSGRDAELAASSKISGGFVNAFPVRARAAENTTLGDYYRAFSTDYMTSITKAHVSPTEIRQALGREEPVFDHLLNAHNFGSFLGAGSGGFRIPGIEFLGGELFDNLSTDLCVYFVSPKGEYGCSYAYNRNAVSDENIRILADCYERIMEQIARAEPETTLREIRSVDISVFRRGDMMQFANNMAIAGKLRKIPVFETLSDGELLLLAEMCKLRSYVADDLILRAKTLTDGVSFVTRGFVELSRPGLDGWDHTLKSVKAGRPIALAGLWEDVPSYVTATAISNDVEVLTVPRSVMTEIMTNKPVVALALLKEAEAEGRNYSYLWITAD